jgi:Predicted pPIWI-associating nuclease
MGMTDEATLRGWLVDDFSQHVLTGAFRVVADRENPLRLNLFAAAVRELFGHTLHALAPDTEVTQCSWYAPEFDTNGPTRRQRVKYATQGGLSDAFIAEVGVDVDHLHDNAIASIKLLSKYTHVRPGVLVTDQAEIDAFVDEALSALLGLFESFKECRDEVLRAIYKHIDQEVFSSFISETIQEIDEIATHYEVNIVWIDDVEITTLSAHHVEFKVTGSIDAELQWRSGSDFRRGDGASLSHDFPFEVSMRAPVEDITAFADVRCSVDNRGWYGVE